MHRLKASIPGSDRGWFVWLAVLCAALGCATTDRTSSFHLREKIPFGVLSVWVDGWEPVGEAHAPLSSLRAPVGEKAIAVFVGWSGLEPYAESDRRIFAEAFLSGRLKLVDSQGFDHKSISAMPRELYYFSLPVSEPRDWVVVFHVPVGSRGYALHLNHPNGAGAGFDVAVVDLG